jgi:PQQ-dependent catabolism-associated CXXCW motif protein
MRRTGSRRLRLGLVAIIVCLGLSLPAGAAWIEEPEGYRLDDYRAPVPDTLKGGTVVDTAKLQALIAKAHPVLIDVLPAPRKPPAMQPGAVWMPEPRRDIPGSLWLPDVGRGALSPALEAWFRARLSRATDGDPAKPVVFYCLDQCWMSWNAAKRAISFGYRAVYWFPEGTDGWEGAGLPLAEIKPEATP